MIWAIDGVLGGKCGGCFLKYPCLKMMLLYGPQHQHGQKNKLERNKHQFIIPIFPAESESGIVFYISHQEPEILDDALCIFLGAR